MGWTFIDLRIYALMKFFFYYSFFYRPYEYRTHKNKKEETRPQRQKKTHSTKSSKIPIAKYYEGTK